MAEPDTDEAASRFPRNRPSQRHDAGRLGAGAHLRSRFRREPPFIEASRGSATPACSASRGSRGPPSWRTRDRLVPAPHRLDIAVPAGTALHRGKNWLIEDRLLRIVAVPAGSPSWRPEYHAEAESLVGGSRFPRVPPFMQASRPTSPSSAIAKRCGSRKNRPSLRTEPGLRDRHGDRGSWDSWEPLFIEARRNRGRPRARSPWRFPRNRPSGGGDPRSRAALGLSMSRFLREPPFIEARTRTRAPSRCRVAVPAGIALHRGGRQSIEREESASVAVPAGPALHRGNSRATSSPISVAVAVPARSALPRAWSPGTPPRPRRSRRGPRRNRPSSRLEGRVLPEQPADRRGSRGNRPS